MSLRTTIKWCLTLTGLVVLAGVGMAAWVWSRSDDWLEEKILKNLAETAPGWQIEIGRAHYDWNRRVEMRGVTICAGENEPLVTLPEVEVFVDRQTLADEARFVIERVRLVEPVVVLARDAAGRWNWQNLPPLVPNDKPLPEFHVERATVRLRFEQPGGGSPAIVTLRRVDLKLIPSGRREFLIQGLTEVERAGTLTINGHCHLDKKTWNVEGRINGVTVDGNLFALVADASPQIKADLARLDATLHESVPGETLTPTKYAMAERDDVVSDGGGKPLAVSRRNE
ncbi:MAG: hypothetical protein ACREIV_07670, partial [Planctomycetaceae bacterium]